MVDDILEMLIDFAADVGEALFWRRKRKKEKDKAERKADKNRPL